ncbi:hypothetical protein RRG08_038288 [Elysia crispata]|uniref:Uncharacterized protein n=1 Tax=Elysia crispata TaxID=231223 RepID=A0AAE1AQ71_9GAST|nr:hypothetical protein RRG08_038288 [Elysia crispata]
MCILDQSQSHRSTLKRASSGLITPPTCGIYCQGKARLKKHKNFLQVSSSGGPPSSDPIPDVLTSTLLPEYPLLTNKKPRISGAITTRVGHRKPIATSVRLASLPVCV